MTRLDLSVGEELSTSFEPCLIEYITAHPSKKYLFLPIDSRIFYHLTYNTLEQLSRRGASVALRGDYYKER